MGECARVWVGQKELVGLGKKRCPNSLRILQNYDQWTPVQLSANHNETINQLMKHYSFEELKEGMSAVCSRTITDTDLRNFSGVSGDTNPMHLSEEYARTTCFKVCIVHGFLTASLLSTVIGTKLPGAGCICVSQSLFFKAPVHVGETVYAKATITKLLPEKHRAVIKTQCFVKDSIVLDGEAVMRLPD